MFMLMGIVKKNGIMIVDFARHRVEAGEAADRAIHDASMDRFRPILMTTLAAVVGAVPIALGFGADGASRRPLGLVIVGGLMVSQLITLYVTPVIYLYLEEFQARVLDRTSLLPLRSASGGRPRRGERPRERCPPLRPSPEGARRTTRGRAHDTLPGRDRPRAAVGATKTMRAAPRSHHASVARSIRTS